MHGLGPEDQESSIMSIKVAKPFREDSRALSDEGVFEAGAMLQ